METLDWPSLHLNESLEEIFFFALGGLEHDDLLLASVEVVQVRQGRQLFMSITAAVPCVVGGGTCSLGFTIESVVEKEEPGTWSDTLGVTDALTELLWDITSVKIYETLSKCQKYDYKNNIITIILFFSTLLSFDPFTF